MTCLLEYCADPALAYATASLICRQMTLMGLVEAYTLQKLFSFTIQSEFVITAYVA